MRRNKGIKVTFFVVTTRCSYILPRLKDSKNLVPCYKNITKQEIEMWNLLLQCHKLDNLLLQYREHKLKLHTCKLKTKQCENYCHILKVQKLLLNWHWHIKPVDFLYKHTIYFYLFVFIFVKQ